MVDKDIIFEKINNIQNCIKRISTVTQNKPKTLKNIDTQDIFVLNLQRAVQSTIDLASHIASSEGLGLPNTLKEVFDLLKNQKIINATLCKKMHSMVGFRNIAIHEYSAINVEVLKEILKKNLVDIEDFYEAILKYFKLV